MLASSDILARPTALTRPSRNLRERRRTRESVPDRLRTTPDTRQFLQIETADVTATLGPCHCVDRPASPDRVSSLVQRSDWVSQNRYASAGRTMMPASATTTRSPHSVALAPAASRIVTWSTSSHGYCPTPHPLITVATARTAVTRAGR